MALGLGIWLFGALQGSSSMVDFVYMDYQGVMYDLQTVALVSFGI